MPLVYEGVEEDKKAGSLRASNNETDKMQETAT